MKSTLERICQLQPRYSSANTAEMQERGRLIRSELAMHLRKRLLTLQQVFDPVFDDLEVEGSDGIGRKTEAPWIRIYSKTMSPSAREGFYVVVHFAADGSAVFITVGCGSTIWSGEDLRPIKDSELNQKTDWARSVVLQHWNTLVPFTDKISLGARAPLPRSFEKATALACRVPFESINENHIDGLLAAASARLSVIYLAQINQRDVSPGDQGIAEVTSIARPLRQQRRGQGISLNAAERKAVEIRAMKLALEYLQKAGFTCTDTSASESYDIRAVTSSGTLKIEVKGTTSDLCDSVLMTSNEVDLHRKEKGSTGLIIVSKVRLDRSLEAPTATGGHVEALLRWDIDTWASAPIAFQVTRPRK